MQTYTHGTMIGSPPPHTQVESLVNHYEEYGTRRDWVEAITNALAAEVPPGERAVKRAAVARQLKELGLKRGGYTARQVVGVGGGWGGRGGRQDGAVGGCSGCAVREDGVWPLST